MIECVQPLLTKIKSGEADLDLDQLKSVLTEATTSIQIATNENLSQEEKNQQILKSK